MVVSVGSLGWLESGALVLHSQHLLLLGIWIELHVLLLVVHHLHLVLLQLSQHLIVSELVGVVHPLHVCKLLLD